VIEKGILMLKFKLPEGGPPIKPVPFLGYGGIVDYGAQVDNAGLAQYSYYPENG
jgi:hypothetical protein